MNLLRYEKVLSQKMCLALQKNLLENCQAERRRMLKYLKNFIPLRASISINENFMSKVWENSEEVDLNDL